MDARARRGARQRSRCRSRSRPSGSAAAHDAPARPARVGRAEPERRRRERDVALFEIAHVYLPTGEELPGGALARRRDRRGRLLPREGRGRGALRRRSGRAPLRARGRIRCGPARRARRTAGSASSTRAARGDWGVLRARPRRAVRRSVPERVAYEDVITFPPLKQDLAFVVDEEVPAGELVAAAREAAGPELREMRVFDVYRGEQVGAGKKSVAFGVVVPVARADALRRGRRDAARADRRRARRALRRRAARLAQSVRSQPRVDR